MAKLTLTDLPVNADLDTDARDEIRGAYFPMANIVALFETMEFTQNASTFTIFNQDIGGSVFTNIQNSALTAASPMQVTKISAT